MGGALAAESVEGEGTTFFFEVEFGEAPPDAVLGESGVRAAGEHRRLEHRARRGRILVAEDNPVNQLVITRILETLGFDVHVVIDGSKAVEALSERYDLVLMDCQMPRMDGFEAAHLIRAGGPGISDPRVPIVALTASAIEGGRERCLAAGMDDFVAKPVTPSDLAQVLDRWLATRSGAES